MIADNMSMNFREIWSERYNNEEWIVAYATYTVTCPHCGSTTTVNTGIKSSGTGVGSCGACRKLVRVEVDSHGNIKRVLK